MHRAAVLTLAQTLVAVELIKQRRKVAHNAFQFHFRAMHQLVAVRAVPFETVENALWTRHLHHHPDAAGHALRRMPHMFGQQENLAFFDGNFKRRLSRFFHHANRNIALQLVEELFRGIVVIIASLVRSPHDRDHHLAVFPHLRITDRRLEFVFVLFDPRLKVESPQAAYGWHRLSYFTGLLAKARISISKCGCGNWCTATVVRAGPSCPKYSPYTPLYPPKSFMLTRKVETSTTSSSCAPALCKMSRTFSITARVCIRMSSRAVPSSSTSAPAMELSPRRALVPDTIRKSPARFMCGYLPRGTALPVTILLSVLCVTFPIVSPQRCSSPSGHFGLRRQSRTQILFSSE